MKREIHIKSFMYEVVSRKCTSMIDLQAEPATFLWTPILFERLADEF